MSREGNAPLASHTPSTAGRDESYFQYRVTQPVDPPKENVQLLLRDGGDTTPKMDDFYTKVLTNFVGNDEVKLHSGIEVRQASWISSQKIDETKTALKELGLNDYIEEK